MDGVHQFDLDLVLAGRQFGYVDRVVITCFRPQPRQVVDVYVQMSNTWRYVEGVLAEHRSDFHVFRSLRDPDDALRPAGQEVGGPRSLVEAVLISMYGFACCFLCGWCRCLGQLRLARWIPLQLQTAITQSVFYSVSFHSLHMSWEVGSHNRPS